MAMDPDGASLAGVHKIGILGATQGDFTYLSAAIGTMSRHAVSVLLERAQKAELF